MSSVVTEPCVQHNAAISTWYRVGGRADNFITARSERDIIWALETGQPVRVLGQGANLLVDDDGIDGYVLSLRSPAFESIQIDPRTHLVRAGAGVDLRKLITVTTNAGLAGLEVLGGIPASVGGAVRMNAGGRFGEIASCVARVHAVDSLGRRQTLDLRDLDFGYRHSGLDALIITSVEFALLPEDPVVLRNRLRDCMAYKKQTQPLAERSAGCAFKNPLLIEPIEDVGPAGTRASAGKLIDLAGCKGLCRGGAQVSQRHGNFLTTHAGAAARDLITLMDDVATRVFDRFGIWLEREVVVWSRST